METLPGLLLQEKSLLHSPGLFTWSQVTRLFTGNLVTSHLSEMIRGKKTPKQLESVKEIHSRYLYLKKKSSSNSLCGPKTSLGENKTSRSHGYLQNFLDSLPPCISNYSKTYEATDTLVSHRLLWTHVSTDNTSPLFPNPVPTPLYNCLHGKRWREGGRAKVGSLPGIFLFSESRVLVIIICWDSSKTLSSVAVRRYSRYKFGRYWREKQ